MPSRARFTPATSSRSCWISFRTRASTSRAASATAACPSRATSPLSSAERNSSSTEGKARSRSDLRALFTGEPPHFSEKPRMWALLSDFDQAVAPLPVRFQVHQSAREFVGLYRRIFSGERVLGLAPRQLKHLAIAQQIGHAEAWHACLPCAEKLAGAPLLKIKLGDFKAIRGAGHGVKSSFGFVGNPAARHQHAK